jgi:hypothetical protein
LRGVEEDAEAEVDEDLEDFFKSRSKGSASTGKLKSKSSDMLSAPKDEKTSQSQRTSSVSPPTASVPISDAPKTVQRVKTPPLMGFGFGTGSKKPASKPSASDKEAGKTAPQHILPASPSSPDVFATPVPQKPNGFGGSPYIPSSQRTQAPAPARSPVGMPHSPTITPGLPAPFAQAKSEATLPRENQKPTVNGQVDRIISIMEKELEQVRGGSLTVLP